MRIIQLETAVGAAMKNFEGAHGKIKIRILLFGVRCKNLLIYQESLHAASRLISSSITILLPSLFTSAGINVPRRRFLPVKTCSDLLLVMSNLYDMNHGRLDLSPLRQFPSVPIVQLSGPFFKKVRSQNLSKCCCIKTFDLCFLKHCNLNMTHVGYQ